MKLQTKIIGNQCLLLHPKNAKNRTVSAIRFLLYISLLRNIISFQFLLSGQFRCFPYHKIRIAGIPNFDWV